MLTSIVVVVDDTGCCCCLQSGLSLLMLLSNNIWVLINYMSFVQWLSVGMSVAGLVYLRYKKPDMHRPIKVRGRGAGWGPGQQAAGPIGA